MTDRDNITLPREAVEKIHEAWGSEVYPPATSTEWYDIMDALRAALAAEQPKPEPVAWQERHFFPKVGEWTHWYDCRPRMADYPREQIEQNGVRYQWRPLYPAPPEDEALRREDEK